MQTPQEPQPVSLRISVTDRCTLRCRYCMPAESMTLAPRHDVLRLEEVLEFARLVQRHFGLAKVRITGGEPLLRRNLCALVSPLAALGPGDLALTTNAARLPAMAADLCRAGLRRVNISLDTLHPLTYRTLTRGGELAHALAGIDAARQAGLHPVRLNMVVLRGINDREVGAMARFGLDRGCEVRFLELMPIGVAKARHEEWFVSSAQVRERLVAAFDLQPLPRGAGSSSRNFLARDAEGRCGVIGFISPCTDPFCGDCRRLRLTATGRLIGCLAQEEGCDIRAILRGPQPLDEARLVAAIEDALRSKQGARHFAEHRLMARVGG